MAGRDVTARLTLPKLPIFEVSIRKKLAKTSPGEVCMFKETVDGKELLVIIANRADGCTITLISKDGTLQL